MADGEFLPVGCAADVVVRIQTVVTFRLGFGARCPLCGAWNGTKTGEKNGRRYHVCDYCGLPYKSAMT